MVVGEPMIFLNPTLTLNPKLAARSHDGVGLFVQSCARNKSHIAMRQDAGTSLGLRDYIP